MSAWARPGVKCVCVDDSPLRRTNGSTVSNPLRLGQVYTIKEVHFDPERQKVRIYVAEAKHPSEGKGKPWGFFVERFRPLITKTQEQDAELFRHHLAGLPVGEPV